MSSKRMSMQKGVTLIEVLVALLVFSIGALGAVMLQLNALKYTDSAMRSSQVSFIAQDILERIRANPHNDYSLSSLAAAPGVGNPHIPRDQDLFDFADHVRRMGGANAQASILVTGNRATVTLDWDDTRAEHKSEHTQTFSLSAVVWPERRNTR